MSATENLHIRKLPDVGLVCEDARVYGYFGTSLPRAESTIPGLGGVDRYTHGVITSKPGVVSYRKDGRSIKAPAKGWHMVRTTDVTGELIPGHEGPLDVHLRQNLIVVPAENVDELIEAVSQYPLDSSADTEGLLDVYPPSKLPAERLYRAVRSRIVEGVGYTACGTYQEVGGCLQVVVADETGGYSFGVPGMEGLVNDQQLTRMSQAAVKLAVG